jgi:hypothetical protein
MAALPAAKRVRLSTGRPGRTVCMPGKAFPNIPGAVVCVMADVDADVAWPVTGPYITDVLHYPHHGYVVVDPSSTYSVDGAYSRAADSFVFVPRHTVSRIVAQDTARRRVAANAKAGAPLSLKRSGCARMTWELPNGLLRGWLKCMPTNDDFRSHRDARALLDQYRHTLVLPADGRDLYASFFRHGLEAQEHAAYNWDVHAFAAAVACTLSDPRGPVRFSRGAFVFNQAFYDALLDNFEGVLCAYLVRIRRACWSTQNRVLHQGSHLAFSTDTGGHVSEWGYARKITGECTYDPPPSGLGLPEHDFLYELFRGHLEGQGHESGDTATPSALPTMPKCILHFFGVVYEGTPPPVRDNVARSKAAKFVGVVARRFSMSPYRVVDHRAAFAEMGARRTAHYKIHLDKLYDKVRADQPCYTISPHVEDKGLTCPRGACAASCAAVNGVDPGDPSMALTPLSVCGL